jgi:hypothetical protein
MHDATDNAPSADEAVAAVRALQDQYDVLLNERDELLESLEQAQARRDAGTLVVVMELPNGRRWSFQEDVNVLAVSPALSLSATERLLAQISPPTLSTCPTCAAPLYAGTACGMCTAEPRHN